MSMDSADIVTTERFLARLETELPQASSLVGVHRRLGNGVPNVLLLVSDLRDVAVAWFHHGDHGLLECLLGILSDTANNGDLAMTNAVEIGFVHGLGWRRGESAQFVEALPRPLLVAMHATQNSGRWQDQPEHPLHPDFSVTIGPPDARVVVPSSNSYPPESMAYNLKRVSPQD